MAETVTKTVALPNWKNKFLIEIEDGSFVPIAGMTGIKMTMSKNIESYFDLNNNGWASKGVVSGEFNVSASIKRILGDPGNEEVFSTLLYLDPEHMAKNCRVEFSTGKILQGTFLISVNDFLGDTAALETMEVEFHCNGEPTLIEETGE